MEELCNHLYSVIMDISKYLLSKIFKTCLSIILLSKVCFLQFIVLISVINPLFCQEISKTYYVADNEPNTGDQIAEIDGGYILGGQYFDSNHGGWTCSYMLIDEEGELMSVLPIRNDTLPLLSLTNFVNHKEGLYLFSPYNSGLRIIRYDKESDTAFVETIVDQIEYNFAAGSSIEVKEDVLFIAGRNFIEDERHLAILRLENENVHVNHYEELTGSSRNCLELEDGRIILTRVRRDDSVSHTKNETSLVFLNSQYEVIQNNTSDAYVTELTPSRGFLVDKDENFWITGMQVEVTGGNSFLFHPIVVKYSNDGELVFNKRVSVHQPDHEGWNRIESIIETHEKDGLLLVGAEVKYNTPSTLKSVGIIKKINYNGQVVWEREFDFRTGTSFVRDELSKIIKTKDGGYAISGTSYDHFFESPGPWIQSIFIKLDSGGLTNQARLIDSSFGITIYPNPAIDKIIVDLGLNYEYNKLFIKDTDGAQVFFSKILPLKESIELDVASFKQGNYILSLSNDAGIIHSRQFCLVR